MPAPRLQAARTRKVRAVFLTAALGVLFLLQGCATGEREIMADSRAKFLEGRVEEAERVLYTSAVPTHGESRLQQMLWLASHAVAEGLPEKALFFLERARTKSLEVRADRAGFDVFSSEYKSNPLEFSYLHYLLVASNLALAQEGSSPAWSVPEVKAKNGEVLIEAFTRQARKLEPREILERRNRARAEISAWDGFLELLKKTYPGTPIYQDDALEKLIAVHFLIHSPDRIDRRTGEILANSPLLSSSVLGASIFPASSKRPLVLVESGVLPPVSKRRVVVGLSLLFQGIEDPSLRMEMERFGLQMLFHYAPEFGLIAFAGAVAGAAGAGDDPDRPLYFTDLADRGIGFEIAFPQMKPGPGFENGILRVTNPISGMVKEFPLSVVSPLQDLFSREFGARSELEWKAKAIKIGVEYLAILIPAIKLYRDADREGNGFKKFAVLAAFFLSKKAIDRINEPDLRTWSLLPQVISGCAPDLPPGEYRAEVDFSDLSGKKTRSLGLFRVPDAPGSLIRLRAAP